MNPRSQEDPQSKLMAWAAEIKKALDASPKLPVDRWTRGVTPWGFSVMLSLHENEITVQDHTLNNSFVISAQTLATSSPTQAVAKFMRAREFSLLTGLLDRPPTGPAIISNIETYLNDPANGCVKPGNLFKEWTARFSTFNPLEMVVTRQEGSRSGLAVRVPKIFLLNQDVQLGDYVRSCSSMMSEIQAKCAEGVPYDGDDGVTDSLVNPSSFDRWSVEHISDLYYMINDNFRLVKIPFTPSLLYKEGFDVAEVVRYCLSQQYRAGVGLAGLVTL